MHRRSRRVAFLASLSLLLILGTGAIGQAAVHPQTVKTTVKSAGLMFATSRFASTGAEIARYSDGKITNVSDDGLSDQMPAVSPDGSRIAYQSAEHVEGNGVFEPSLDGLYVMNINGNNKTQVTSTKPSISSPGFNDQLTPQAWNSTDTTLVFWRTGLNGDADESEIDTIHADGSGLTVLATAENGRWVQTPSWSPNGKYIAYSYCSTRGGCSIYVMNANGRSLHQILAATAVPGNYAYDPVWSPNSSKIYFDNGSDIFGMTADGSGLVQLTDSNLYDTGPDYEPTVSSNGTTIAYTDNGNIDTISASAKQQRGIQLFSDGIEPSFITKTWPNTDTKTVVALGDSVAAGEGINYGFSWDKSGWVQTGPNNPTWADTTSALGANYQGCHQSGDGFPNLIAVNNGYYRVYNMACTGASVPNGILGPEVFTDGPAPPAQLGWGGLPGGCSGCSRPSAVFNAHNPDIVLLTVGADDITFSSWVKTCYKDTADCGSSSHTSKLNGQLSTEEQNLRLVLIELNRWARNKSKTLKVYVTNYYDPFSTSHTGCIDVNNGGHFPGISVSGTGNALGWLMSGLKHLNSNISTGVTYAQHHDSSLSVHLVDLSHVMSGHEFCSTDPWVYGPSINYPSWQHGAKANYPAPFHPTPQGQRAIESIVSSALSR